ncbi:Nn.00g024680.m01.CDS01 [Neocucurbitaria sp. VM-36]
MASSQSPDEVFQFLCDHRFHNQLTLPPDPAKGTKSSRVSYAYNGDSTSNTVVLFCGDLMGGRLSYSPLDQLAKTCRIRIIHPDRPEAGGTDPVALT